MSATATPPDPATRTPPPAGAGPRPWTWTREQYYRLGELGVFQGRRVELVRGEIIEMSPINRRHAVATGLTADALRLAFATAFHINVQQPFSVPGGAAGSEPQPDVTVVPGAHRDYADHPTVAALLVEVADSSLFFDTTTKAELYATAGVPEYWVLDVDGRQLHVFRGPVALPTGLGATAYQTHLVLGEGDAVSPLSAAAEVRVADLLP